MLARHFPDRFMHRRRHLEARRRLARLYPVRSILVVCQGNICRSPYMEAVLRQALPAATIASAGFATPGRPVPKNAEILAARRGIDLTTFRSRPVRRANASHADIVIVMDEEQASQMVRAFRVSPSRLFIAGDLDREFGSTRAIRDPWGQSLEVFAESFERLDRCAATLTRLLRR